MPLEPAATFGAAVYAVSTSLFKTKNPSPRVLAGSTAVVIAAANALLSLLLRPPLWVPVAVFIIIGLLSYSLYHYTLQRFIYRKIKLIYKFIYQTKATRREEFFYKSILPQKSIEDVSRDVQQWAALRQREAETLRETEHFRKEFLMNLAHELRTPIFTIQGYVDTLLDGALEDEAVARKFLSATQKSTERLVRLIEDLNGISKLESGRIPLVEETFLIQELVADVYEEFSLRAAERGAGLLLKKGTERVLQVCADKSRIRQVLSNLIENALKYGRDDVQITTGCYVLDNQRVYVEVSDDGPGIAEEHLHRLFERFYRADRSRSREVGGTGLGLAIVKHIIEAHGQTVTVRSTPGVGSSFGFTLEQCVG